MIIKAILDFKDFREIKFLPIVLNEGDQCRRPMGAGSGPLRPMGAGLTVLSRVLGLTDAFDHSGSKKYAAGQA